MPIIDVDEFVSRTSREPARRVLVAGTSGSGKTTLAARIGDALGIEHVEIDALFHGPNWTPRATFLDDVERFSAGAAWVTEWQYSQVRPLLAQRADLIVWLDLPRHVVMRQVVARTVRRRRHREELWNGNREHLGVNLLTRDGILAWFFRTHWKRRREMPGLVAGYPHLRVVRLRSPREADRWLASLTPEAGPALPPRPA